MLRNLDTQADQGARNLSTAMGEVRNVRATGSHGTSLRSSWAAVLILGVAVPAGRVAAGEVRVGWYELSTNITSDSDTLVVLPDVILVRDSVHVWIDSLPLAPGHDFTVDYAARQIRLSHVWPTGTTVTVRYRALPVQWPTRTVWMRPSPPPHDTAQATPPPTAATSRRSPPQSGGDLRVGGTKTFAIQVGSNRDLALEQSLRVSINGTVAENVEVTAELSDQNLPIQPEGTTEDIREIDKVLVEVKSPRYRALLGNYDVSYQRGEFGRYTRRLDGAQAEARFDRWGITGGIASTRGKFRTYQLPAIDGNQGPYRLVDDRDNAGVVVIAGTERVWIDGELLRRGLTNDYTMDYSAGEITFTRKRLVTQEMRIIIDYEFASEQYARTSALASGRYEVGGWRTSVFFAQEGDNADEPLALVIDDAARLMISQAGDDPARASVPGWTPREGGSYRAVDLATEQFEYAGAGNGQYDVSFTRVGPGNGTYVREQGFFSEVFRYVGPLAGDWLPRVLYPLPERHRLLSFWSTFAPVPSIRVEGEAAASDVDRNTLSPVDDGDNVRYAGRLTVTIEDARLAWRQRNMGTISVSAAGRGVQRGFSPLARTTEAEDSRRWGLDLSTDRTQERTLELATVYTPRPGHRLDADLGWFDRDTTATEPAYRAWRSGARWATTARGWPEMKLFVEQIRSRTTPQEGSQSYGAIRRGHAAVRYPFWHLAPSARLEGELDETKRDGRTLAGTRYSLWSAGLATAAIEAFAASASIEGRADGQYDTTLTPGLVARGWTEDQRALMHVWRAAIRQWNGLSATGEYTWRRREGPRVGPATISDVADLDTRHDAWDGLVRNSLRYRVSGTRTAKRERLYVYVGAGRGDYAPVDPADRRAILRESEVMDVPPGDARASYVLRYVDTEQFQPTVQLDASWQTNLDIARAWRGAADPRSNLERPLWQRILRVVATETVLQVSETDSTRNRDLYLAKFWTFRRPGKSPTVRGVWQFRQDLALWSNSRRGDLRVRVSDGEEYDASILQQRDAPAISRTREYAVRARARFVPRDADWQGELVHQRDTRSGSQFDYRARRTLFDQTWAYHPSFQTDWSVRNEFGAGSDPTPDAYVVVDPAQPLRAYLVSFEPGYRRAWGNRGMVRVTGQWSGVFGENLAPGQALPIRLLGGRNSGHNVRWTALVTYRLSPLVTASVTYAGRKTPGSPVTHTARAEVRAVF